MKLRNVILMSVLLIGTISMANIPTSAHATMTADGCLGSAALSQGGPTIEFHPLTATAVELACYGFPPRPQNDPAALAHWQQVMSYITHWTPPLLTPQTTPTQHSASVSPFVVAGQSAPPSIWSGYIAKNRNYNAVEGYWTQQSGKQDSNEVVDWVGLGGTSGSSPLYQAGVHISDPSSYSFFYDHPPAFNVLVGGVAIHPGDSIYTNV